jgi:chromosome segregation ATPase
VASAVLALALAGAAVFAYLQAGEVDDRLSLETRRTAEHAAEAVASRLTTEDVERPMGGTRADEISSFVEQRLLDPSESVTIWSTDAVVVFAADPSLIGTQDGRLSAQISRALSNRTQTETSDGSVHAFVAVVVGEGTRLVAEVIRPDEASSAGRPWIYASIAAGLLAFLALVGAIRTSGRPNHGSSGFGGADDLRRERTNLLQAQGELERSRTEEATLRSELERVTGDLARTGDALAAKETSVGEVDSRIRAAEEQTARAEAELRAGVTVREKVARLIETELQTTRSELAVVKQQHEEAQRQLESGRMAEAQRDAAAAERDALAAERDAIAAERDALRGLDERLRGELDAARANLDILGREMTELGDRYQESAARAAHAEAKVLDMNADLREIGDRPDLTDELQQTRTELDRTKKELGAALQEVETLGQQLAASRGDLEVVRGGQELGTAALDEAREKLSASKAALEIARSNEERALAEAAEARSSFDALSADLSTSHEEAEAAMAEATALTRRLDEQVVRAASAEARVSELSHRVTELESRPDLFPAVEEAKAALETAKDQLADRDAQFAEARSELDAVWMSLQAATAKTDALEGEVERAEARAAELAAEIELRDARGAELAGEVGRAEARAQAAEARAIDLSGRIEAGDTRLHELEDRAERAEGLVTELAARAERAEVRADEMAERAEAAEIAATLEHESPKLVAARAEVENLTAGLAAVMSELDAAAMFASALVQRNEELEKQVASQAVQAEVEAADARARLLETRESLARLQETVEHRDELGPFVQEAPSMTPSAATEVADALSVNVKRALSAIFELARTLSTGQESKDDERLLYQLMTHAKRMEHAIRDIFDADRLTRGELLLERRSTQIDALVRRVVSEFPFADDRDLDVAVEPATIMVDRVRVERLVDDLLTSVVGRTEAGDRIALVLERAPDGVLISVEGGTPLNGDGTAEAAAAFLAEIHGGWTRAERLPDGTGVVRAFLPSGLNAGAADGADPETAAALG